MKNTYKILCALVLLSSAVACSVKDNYEPGTLPDNAQVYFSLDEGTDISLSDGQKTFNVNVFRSVATGAVSVPVSGVDTSGKFTLPQSVSFADGSNKATVQVGVDFDNITSDIDYEISLKIGESEVTPYGIDAISLMVKFSPWTAWAPYKVSPATGVGDYYYDCIGEDFGADMDPALEVEYSQSLANPDNYKFRILHWAYNKTLYFSYNAADNTCSVENGDTGYANDYGEMFVTEFRDYVELFVEAGVISPEAGEELKKGSYYDPETGTFNLCLLYYIKSYGPLDGWWTLGYERFCLDGFKQPDYSVSLKLNGLYVDMPEDDTPYPYANLDVMLGKEGEGSEDIDKVCLVMVPADLSSPETTLEALMLAEQMIVDGEEGVVTLRESVQNYLLPFPEPEITQFVILAASFDESGEIQDEAYITKNLEEEPEPERSAVRSRKVSAHTLKANLK